MNKSFKRPKKIMKVCYTCMHIYCTVDIHWPVMHVSRTSELIINKNSTILLANVFTFIVHNAYKHDSFQLVDIFSAKHERSSMIVRNGMF